MTDAPASSSDTAPYAELVRRIFDGRKVILATGPVAGATPLVRLLRDLGAKTPLLLAECTGTGKLPEPDELEWHVIGHERSDSIMAGIRSYIAALADLPPEAAAAVERYDPDRTALVLPALYVGHPRIAGRRVFGGKRPSWETLEDKVVADELWDRAGVPRVPSRVVPARRAELLAAAAEVDRGDGTVWAADAREGFHGAGDGTRWVRDGVAVDAVIEFMAARADRVRVMPFLEGIPCSIHGIVLDDAVVALRPVEQITLRCPGSAAFHYGGTATFWDPPDADRETMRGLARTVGAHLRERVEFRGAFTIDGVLTDEGFRPTELNPRFGAGLMVTSPVRPRLPLYLLHLAIIAGAADEIDPDAFERLLLEAADTYRGGGAKGFSTTVFTQNEEHAVVEVSGGGYEAAGDRPPDATMVVGPAPIGCFFMFKPDPQRTPVGPSLAPRAVRAMAWADANLGTGFGERVVAREA